MAAEIIKRSIRALEPSFLRLTNTNAMTVIAPHMRNMGTNVIGESV